ncbi:hypothetical protein BKA65DRAFT_266803 [Rhexocercosporidium sp. MPI-PUGE-AT-0058]|nr:hypothetical protein BKA65DRAFT_266803 [Rhexocercosporidium sp. MPI-PUGE-AT-0058]
MSANPGGGGMLPKGVTQEQIDLARELRESMASGGKQQQYRSGRGRSTAPSPALTRGRGPAMASTRPIPSPTPSFHSLNSSTTSRTTHAPGATRSGAVNPHYAQQYRVGPSTPLAISKSPQRQRAASPVRPSNGLIAVPAVKPKSPPKFVRDSILVPDHAKRMVSAGVCTTADGPQDQSLPAQADFTSAWVKVPEQSSAYAAPVPENGGWNTAGPLNIDLADPRFMAVESHHPMTQQSGSFSGGLGQGSAAQVQTMPSAQATNSFGGGQAQGSCFQAGRLAGQSVPDAGRVLITTNWTEDDPTKPIIPGHLRQPNAEKAVQEIADIVGWAVSEFSADGVSIGTGRRADGGISYGVSSSIYAPGNARGSRAPTQYQADINGSDWMFAATSTKHKTGAVRAPSGDGDVEMSDGPTNTQPSAPRGPVEWNNLPKLSSSKYATRSAFTNQTPNVPKPAPTANTSNENVKPAQQPLTRGLGDIGKNIAADIAKHFGVNGAAAQTSNLFASNNIGVNQAALTPTGFSAAAQNAASNPFLANGAGAAKNPSNSPGFGASSAPFVSGSVDHSTTSGQSGFGAGKPAAPVQGLQNSSTTNGLGGPAISTTVPWGSVDHSLPHGQDNSGVAHVIAPVQTSQATTNSNHLGGVTAPVGDPWGSIDHSASNGQTCFGFAQPVNVFNPTGFGGQPATAPAPWGSFDHSAAKDKTDCGATLTQASQTMPDSNHFGGPPAPVAAPWGSVNHSVSSGQTCFGFAQPAAPAGHVWGSVNKPVPDGTSAQNGPLANGFGTPQPDAQSSNGWGITAQPAANANAQHAQGSFSSSGFGSSQPATIGQTTVGNPQVDRGFGASNPASAAQGTPDPFMSNGGFSAGASVRRPPTSQGFGAATSTSQPVKTPGYAGLDAATIAKNLARDLRGMFPGKAADKRPSYEASPFGPPSVRSAAAPNFPNSRQTSSTQSSLYQVVPRTQEVAGLAESRWA